MRAGEESWLTAEPRLGDLARRVLARALRTPLRALAFAAAVAATAVGLRALRPPAYTGTVTLRLAEGALQEPAAAPPLPAAIREWVANVALTRAGLLELMERHGLSPTLRRKNPSLAVEGFRSDLDITVSRNYFLLDRASAAEPRSSMIEVSYFGRDEEQVRAVVLDIAARFRESLENARTRSAGAAVELARLELERERERLGALQAQKVRILRDAERPGVRPAGVRSQLLAVEGDLSSVAARLQSLRTRTAELELAAATEQRQLGFRLQLVDASVRTLRAPMRAGAAALLAALVLLAALPVAAVVAGAFNATLYDASDVLAFGFPLIAAFPPARAIGHRSPGRDLSGSSS